MLERSESVRTREPDLASVILEAPPRARRTYDARSALLLALVVAVLTMVVAVTMGLRTSDGTSARSLPSDSAPRSAGMTGANHATSTTGAAGAKGATGVADATGSTSSPARDDQTRSVAGIALAIGRITATPDTASGGMIVRVGVANAGRDALPAGRGAELLLLVDDQVVGRQPLRSLAGSGAHATFAFTVPTCSSGRHAVTAIADATSRVRDAAGSNGARSRELTFDCPYG